jgi:predicted Fe-Mo cluster-binding NifX family protein
MNGKTKIAVASRGRDDLDDVISDVFGRSPYFVVVDVEGEEVRKVKCIKNEAAERQHGAGPLMCTRLGRLGVNVAIGSNFGPTVSDILKEAGIQSVTVSPGTKIKDAVQDYLKAHRSRRRRRVTKTISKRI